MKITGVKVRIVDIPFHRVAKVAGGTSPVQNFAIVEVMTDEGVTGLGEASCMGGPNWNEETIETVALVIERYLAPLVLHTDPFDVGATLDRMEQSARGNYFAKAAVEMALFDIMGKALNQPVFNLLGGKCRERVQLSWTLATGSAEAEIDEAAELWERGHRIFKFKTGVEDVEKDIVRINAFRRAYPDAVLRIDANMGWDEIATLRVMDGLKDAALDLLEQPVPRWNIEGMARIRARTSVPLMADESVCTPADAVALVRHHAVDVFGLKLAKAGGFRATQHVIGVAVGASLRCYVGCMRETGIGTAAYAHMACSAQPVTMGCELFGPLMLVDDVVNEVTRYQDGYILAPTGPGLGVSLDEAKMRRYARQ